MTDKVSQQDIEKGLNLIETDKNKEIVKCFFLQHLNQPDIVHQTDIKQYKKYKSNLASVKGKKNSREYKGGGNKNKISEAFNLWRRCGFFDIEIKEELRKGKSGSSYNYPVKRYKLNLTPFFEYLRITLPKEKQLTEKEKTFIKFIFLFKESREIVCEYDNFFQGILSFIERASLKEDYAGEPLIESFLKLFFIKNPYYEKYLAELGTNKNWSRETINSFFSNLLNKIIPNVINYKKMWENPEIKYAEENIPPTYVYDDAYLEIQDEAKKLKKSSSQ